MSLFEERVRAQNTLDLVSVVRALCFVSCVDSRKKSRHWDDNGLKRHSTFDARKDSLDNDVNAVLLKLLARPGSRFSKRNFQSLDNCRNAYK